MKSVAVILTDGFEEIEAINTIDILRRATINVEIVGLNESTVTGAHGVTIQADDIFDYYSLLGLDAIIFAGGMPNAVSLSSDQRVLDLINYYFDNGKFVCGICATPALVFSKTKILEGKDYTCYPDEEFKNMVNGNFVDKSVVVAGNVITSQSPYTSMSFALTIAKELGYDITDLQKALKGSL